ncbi:MAG: hypothetical protein LQ342_005048 [Letrouitia transgressa]|nr:MAG: hypothetical protein LQ342_005048 [Letrouitia transgressa]
MSGWCAVGGPRLARPFSSDAGRGTGLSDPEIIGYRRVNRPMIFDSEEKTAPAPEFQVGPELAEGTTVNLVDAQVSGCAEPASLAKEQCSGETGQERNLGRRRTEREKRKSFSSISSVKRRNRDRKLILESTLLVRWAPLGIDGQAQDVRSQARSYGRRSSGSSSTVSSAIATRNGMLQPRA